MTESTTKQRRPGGRSARVRRAVLDAALDVLESEGFDRFSIGAVAARAEVHETSVYRRWGSREALAIDALLDASEQLQVPDTGSLRGDLLAYVSRLAEYLSTGAGYALERVLAGMGDDPAVGRLRDDYWAARVAMSGQMVARAIERGELPVETDPRFVVELAVAPIHFRVVLTREPVDAALAERVVDAVLGGLVGGTGNNPEQHRR